VLCITDAGLPRSQSILHIGPRVPISQGYVQKIKHLEENISVLKDFIAAVLFNMAFLCKTMEFMKIHYYNMVLETSITLGKPS